MKKKVAVAMSGGVDSSAAAFLLKEMGYEVVGITMCLGVKTPDDKRAGCCGKEAIDDAKKVCNRLKISHYAMDFSRELEEKVIGPFVEEYLKGRTPNPCVSCNRYLKFGSLLDKIKIMGFDCLATGHYAKVEDRTLKKPKDAGKDQTYFLYYIKKDSLSSILFPLEDLTKKEVRKIAGKANLPVAEKPQSRDICFIPEGNYKNFIMARVKNIKPGPILDLEGNILGEHRGTVFYTIGQRGGLGMGGGNPFYVISINPLKNQVVVGSNSDLNSRGLIAGRINLLVEQLPDVVFAKIRYTHKEAECRISRKGSKLRVIFNRQQRAVTPGQSVVFYKDEKVLGGGIIEEVVSESGRKN